MEPGLRHLRAGRRIRLLAEALLLAWGLGSAPAALHDWRNPSNTATAVGSSLAHAILAGDGARMCSALGDRTPGCAALFDDARRRQPDAPHVTVSHQATILDHALTLDAYDFRQADGSVVTLVFVVADDVVVQIM